MAGRPKARSDTDPRQYVGFAVPVALKQQLEEAARQGARSLAHECVSRLERSFHTGEVIQEAFGGADSLNLAMLLLAPFQFAGKAKAAQKGHPEWTPAEWMADKDCFDYALQTLNDAIWQHHSQPVTYKDRYEFIQEEIRHLRSRELTKQYYAEQEAAAEQTPNAA